MMQELRLILGKSLDGLGKLGSTTSLDIKDSEKIQGRTRFMLLAFLGTSSTLGGRQDGLIESREKFLGATR